LFGAFALLTLVIQIVTGIFLIRGDYVVGDATLSRFFSLQVIAVPLALLGLVTAHLMALHEVGSNNPDGIEIKAHLGADGHPLDAIPSHPCHTTHGLWGACIFLLCFCAVVFFAPEAGGYFLEHANFIPADSLKTPPHIAPVWYFTPFNSMLRATTDSMVNLLCIIIGITAATALVKGRMGHLAKALLLATAVSVLLLLKALGARFWGVFVMGGSVFILFFLPWLDHAPVKSLRYRPGWHKYVYGVFVASFLALGYLGSKRLRRSATSLHRWGPWSTSASS